MVVDAMKRNERLEAEVNELREILLQRETDLKHSEIERDYLKFQIEKLRRMLFGRRSEKIPPRDDGLRQAEIFEEAKQEIESEDSAEIEEISYQRKKQRAKRKPISA